MNEDLSNTILAYNLASSALSSYLDRVIMIERSGIDVHSGVYNKCLEYAETVQTTLAELKSELEQHKAARDRRYEQTGEWS